MKNIDQKARTEESKLKKFLKKYEKYPCLQKLTPLIGYNKVERYIEEIKQKNFGKKVMIFTGKSSMKKAGFLKQYTNSLKNQKFKVKHYKGINPNPSLKQMIQGTKEVKKFKPDFILAIGGGSTIDTAKVISTKANGNLWNIVLGKTPIKKTIPIIAIATTSGTGSHISPYAVVTNSLVAEKRTLKKHHIIPKLSIIDIKILENMPKKIIASTGFDVLCHALEVFTRKDCTKNHPAYKASLKSMKYLRKHLIHSYKGKRPEDKLGMAMADFYAGIALSLIGTHVPHAISHPLSARFKKIDHGKALAYVFANTLEIQQQQADKILKRKLKIATRTLRIGKSKGIIQTIKKITKLLDLDKKDIKFTTKDIKLIAKDTLGYRKSSIEKSPTPITKQDIEIILEKSLS